MSATDTDEIEDSIQKRIPWLRLPESQKLALGNSQKEYDKRILDFSIRNQIRYKGNLVKLVKRNEEEYYESLLSYSRKKLMLFPYHLSDVVVKGLRVTPFTYYINMLADIMEAEKSYDSLPNFTAADGVRLLGIGRNQYIDLMNQSRSSRRLFRRNKNVRELLPTHPVNFHIEPWFLIIDGCILETDIRALTSSEKEIIDKLLDTGPIICGTVDKDVVRSLYNKGLVYFEVPITNADYVYVPTLDGFVMNRVQGDFLETLLYKIFVTLDGQMTSKDISEVLDTDEELVQNAISVFCRLGFAKKRQTGVESMSLHSSWYQTSPDNSINPSPNISLKEPLKDQQSSGLSDLSSSLVSTGQTEFDEDDDLVTALDSALSESPSDLNNLGQHAAIDTALTPTPSVASDNGHKRIAFLFDSSLAAFLMMGNLSTSLKAHAVTLFEVGKLGDESVDNFVEELHNVKFFAEGEAQRYSEHALTLLHTIEGLRTSNELDLIRGESLLNLDKNARQRVVQKSYRAIFGMAPINPEACSLPPISSIAFFGTPCVEVGSPWFRLWLYELVGDGIPSVYIPMGTRVRRLPPLLGSSPKVVLSTGAHEPLVLPTGSALLTLNETLLNAAVMIQGYPDANDDAEIVNVPFSFKDDFDEKNAAGSGHDERAFVNHPSVIKLRKALSLDLLCGYIVLVKYSPKTFYPKPFYPAPTISDGESDSENDDFEDVKDISESSLPAMSAKEQERMGSPRSSHTPDSLFAIPTTASWSNSITKDPRKIVSKKFRLDDGESFNDYRLFDCLFGTPLFDEHLNKQICTKIITADLLSSENIHNVKFAIHHLIESSQKFVAKYRNFNSQFSGMETDVNSLPLPTDPVAYHPDKNEVRLSFDVFNCS